MEVHIIKSGAEMKKKLETLKEIRVYNVNLVTYYLDEHTGEKWIEEYPFPEMHAGGPPQLLFIDNFPWE